MKGYCRKCGKVIDETEQLRGVCYDCYKHIDLRDLKIPKWMERE